MMNIKRLLTIACMGLALGTAACTAEVEDKGALPDVDVKGGEMPKVDVDPANIEVGTDTQTVVTPEVSATPAEGGEK